MKAIKILPLVLFLTVTGCVVSAIDDATLCETPTCIESNTAENLCRIEARRVCAEIGETDDPYCLIVLAQECSPEDRETAQTLCENNPNIQHRIASDGSCHLVWR